MFFDQVCSFHEYIFICISLLLFVFTSFVAVLQSLSSYQKRMAERQKLPAWAEQDKVLANVQENQVVVISGMTG